MKIENNIVRTKSLNFAIRIINLYKVLSNERNEYVMSKQILRSGTSIGANIAEASCAISKKDFLSKNYIALKEATETEYWLTILEATSYLSHNEYESVQEDCKELCKLLTSICKTVSESIKTGIDN